MTLQVQISHGMPGYPKHVAVINAATRVVLALLGSDDVHGDVLHDGQAIMLVEVDPGAAINIGEPLTNALLPPAVAAMYPISAGDLGVGRASLSTDIGSVFKFNLDDEVRLGKGNTVGKVTAFSQHRVRDTDLTNRIYCVRSHSADGRVVSEWIDEQDLSHGDAPDAE